jgi:small subunit ribosomal protein S19
MSRPMWKGPAFNTNFYKNIFLLQKRKTCSRSTAVPKKLMGRTVFVYSGNSFKRCSISRARVGFKLGEFSYSKNYKFVEKSVSKNKKKK